MASPIAHFVSFEVGNLIHTISRLGSLAGLRHVAFIAVFGMIAVIYMALEILRAMKPWTSADEDATRKPFRAVVAVGGTAIGRAVIVTIGTFGGYSDFDSDLSLLLFGELAVKLIAATAANAEK